VNLLDTKVLDEWGSFSGTLDRKMKEGSGNGTSLINFMWAPFWTQTMLGV